MKRITSLLLASLATLALAGTASATIILSPLAVDFRTAAWSGAHSQSSWTVGDVTASALQDDLYQDSTDGLGILGGENDEVDLEELLCVDFGNGGKWLTGVWITDLFEANDGGIGEYGKIQLNGGAEFQFNGNLAHQGNGELYVDFGGAIQVTSAKFWADNTLQGIDRSNNDFSVAGFTETSPVPEPATLVLLGGGILGIAGAARRRRKA